MQIYFMAAVNTLSCKEGSCNEGGVGKVTFRGKQNDNIIRFTRVHDQ